MRYKPIAGESISQIAQRMVALARIKSTTVTTTFNGIKLKATRLSEPINIETYYRIKREIL